MSLQKERNVIFMSSVIAYLGIPRNYIKKLLELIRKFNIKIICIYAYIHIHIYVYTQKIVFLYWAIISSNIKKKRNGFIWKPKI